VTEPLEDPCSPRSEGPGHEYTGFPSSLIVIVVVSWSTRSTRSTVTGAGGFTFEESPELLDHGGRDDDGEQAVLVGVARENVAEAGAKMARKP
jgi:hypothetical protein